MPDRNPKANVMFHRKQFTFNSNSRGTYIYLLLLNDTSQVVALSSFVVYYLEGFDFEPFW